MWGRVEEGPPPPQGTELCLGGTQGVKEAHSTPAPQREMGQDRPWGHPVGGH